MNCSTCPFIEYCTGATCPMSPDTKEELYQEFKAKGELEEYEEEDKEEDFNVPF